uniref:Pre-mRNA 3'-end-processing factor FIP1 n=1 Tax=Astyanax mexicanus TaxID=7994 RepID=A0A8B9KGF4_ASTMX
MSAEEAEKAAGQEVSAAAGDEEEEWLYGDEGETKENEEEEEEAAKLTAAISAPPAAPVTEEVPAGNGVASQEEAPGDDEDSESDSDDDDDDVRVTIGDIKTGAPQYTTYGATPVNLNIKSGGSRPYGAGAKVKGVDLDAPGNINGVPVLEVEMESFEEKPWRKPGADLSDYFNYGFNEETWKAYCEKQKRLRMGLDVNNITTTTSKISVQQGRTGNEKEVSVATHVTKPDFTSPSSLYKPGLNPARISPPQWPLPVNQEPPPYYTKTSGTIDVIGGQTATISRVEGRRRHNLEGNNIQWVVSIVLESTTTSPPHNLLSIDNSSQHRDLLADLTQLGISGYPPPPIQPPVSNWPGMMDNSKQWDYYPRRDKERDKERERERPRERAHDREREREREHSPSSMAYNSDEERYRYRDYGDRGYDRHRERASREKEERHRERRHREKEEGRHKSSRSSSRRRHDSEEGDGHRRHKHKKSKRSKEGKEPSEERAADQENQEAME